MRPSSVRNGLHGQLSSTNSVERSRRPPYENNNSDSVFFKNMTRLPSRACDLRGRDLRGKERARVPLGSLTPTVNTNRTLCYYFLSGFLSVYLK